MRVLLLGVTGRVGSRLLPALLAHKHTVIAYVRDRARVKHDVASRVSSIVTGSTTNSNEIKDAILLHQCDAVINSAGFAPVFRSSGDFPLIFSSVVKAAEEVKRLRGGVPLRCWLMSGWPLMDSPNKPHLIMDYAPIYPNHRTNYDRVRTVPTNQIAWSLFCASNMIPRTDQIDYSPLPGSGAINLHVEADTPTAWSETLRWVPFFGTHLNIMAQTQSYYTPLEDCVDFIAGDLNKGIDSEWVGKRVGVKSRSSSI